MRALVPLVLAALLAASPAGAADPVAGKAKARACAVCHGINGIAKVDDAPNIAGDSASYIERQLAAYRSGERKHEQMSIMAEPLSDADIADLAAWFSSIRVEATLPN